MFICFLPSNCKISIEISRFLVETSIFLLFSMVTVPGFEALGMSVTEAL